MVPGALCCLLLDRDPRIRAASRDYERVTLREHGELPGQYLFDAFPDNPKDPLADGTTKLALSLETAMQSLHPHTMPMQRYDIPGPTALGALKVRAKSVGRRCEGVAPRMN